MEDSQPQIIFEDDNILGLFKPSGWHVHPPENPIHRRGLKRKTCVQWLMDFHQKKANPAHRIDVATEGLLVFAKNRESAKHLGQQFINQSVQKEYHAVVRGWLREPQGSISIPLESDSTGELAECLTDYTTTARLEFNHQINPAFPTVRYSLLEVFPKTGRWHQIRRHMNRVAHPIVGDREHGDSRHNRYFREQHNIPGLCLRAQAIRFQHPVTNEILHWNAPESEKWNLIKNLFSAKPL